MVLCTKSIFPQVDMVDMLWFFHSFCLRCYHYFWSRGRSRVDSSPEAGPLVSRFSSKVNFLWINFSKSQFCQNWGYSTTLSNSLKMAILRTFFDVVEPIWSFSQFSQNLIGGIFNFTQHRDGPASELMQNYVGWKNSRKFKKIESQFCQNPQKSTFLESQFCKN